MYYYLSNEVIENVHPTMKTQIRLVCTRPNYYSNANVPLHNNNNYYYYVVVHYYYYYVVIHLRNTWVVYNLV